MISSSVAGSVPVEDNAASVSAGGNAGFHFGIVGVNVHYDALGNGKQVCLRVGPGLYIGGGNEVGATFKIYR